jgi:hypothetical protein
MYIDTATSILPIMPGLPQTSSSNGYSNTVSIISKHITRAENFVNGKVARRYDISGFTSTSHPPLLKTLTEDITTYYTFRSLYSADNQNVNEWTDKFLEARDTLDQIMSGDLDLVDEGGDLIEERSSSTTDYLVSNTEDFSPTFDEGNVLDWRVSNSKKTAIKEDKN